MFNASKVDVWVATVSDQPGALREKLEGLAKAGADLDFLLARRTPEKPGEGIVFVAQLSGDAQIRAAKQLGFQQSSELHCVRVTGSDEPGSGYLVTRAIAAQGLNLRGVSASAVERQFVMYLAFDTAADADRAVRTLQRPI
ncbi:MAG: amino acid-binding protein [Tepidisphaeraceae bacterium]|jgi:predicted amino acid-binding ACT domain protein